MTCRKIYLAILMPKEAPVRGGPWQIAHIPFFSNCISTKEKFARSVTCKNKPCSLVFDSALLATLLFPRRIDRNSLQLFAKSRKSISRKIYLFSKASFSAIRYESFDSKYILRHFISRNLYFLFSLLSSKPLSISAFRSPSADVRGIATGKIEYSGAESKLNIISFVFAH